MTHKLCTKCKKEKLVSEFSKKNQKGRPERLQPICKECAKVVSKDWYKSNFDKAKNSRLKKTYGITLAEYNKILPTHCPICGKLLSLDDSLGSDTPVVDHCHTHGHVRGIICNECNRGLGYFKDNPTALRNAATYLENARAVHEKS